MDTIDVLDRLEEVNRCIGCVSTLLASQDHIPARGGDLATLLAMLQTRMEEATGVLAEIKPVLH